MPIIEVEHLSKKYRIGAQKEGYLSLRDESVKKRRASPGACPIRWSRTVIDWSIPPFTVGV